ncbi:uncharacterized protein LOC109713211 [Ananas comosus]|uniref:Uncharacterized protein LOC109713211 n=1 Tax=Ananas comosus TaxID=4615 RepID=A0A199UK48_ANACO|nr:uncharacterized protein LOC109713211 [Ananas comosus]OAY64960.1 hypothetical protein ACMD2_13296 [Ananas comosus]
MKKISVILRKCRSLSKLGRSSSYSSLRSQSARDEDFWDATAMMNDEDEDREAVVFVGSSRRRYVIRSKHLNHPLLDALIDRSEGNTEDGISVKCEVVLFDHLLWMLENADPEVDADDGALQELAKLYAY